MSTSPARFPHSGHARFQKGWRHRAFHPAKRDWTEPHRPYGSANGPVWVALTVVLRVRRFACHREAALSNRFRMLPARRHTVPWVSLPLAVVHKTRVHYPRAIG